MSKIPETCRQNKLEIKKIMQMNDDQSKRD